MVWVICWAATGSSVIVPTTVCVALVNSSAKPQMNLRGVIPLRLLAGRGKLRKPTVKL